jgi:SAM-dependent methyltransferase
MAEGYGAIYEDADLYELAFSYRDIPREVDFLLAASAAYGRAAPRDAVEYACGPAYHLRELARRGLSVTGVDLSDAMAARAEAAARREGLSLSVLRGDMRDSAPPPADLACIMLSSLHHLLADADLSAHLSAAGRALRQGGIYLIEAIHPEDFTKPAGRETRWEVEANGARVRARWRLLRELPGERCETELSLVGGLPGAERALSDRSLLRRHARPSLEALITAEGSFEVAATLGDLDLAVPFESKEAWRMVLILRKR